MKYLRRMGLYQASARSLDGTVSTKQCHNCTKYLGLWPAHPIFYKTCLQLIKHTFMDKTLRKAIVPTYAVIGRYCKKTDSPVAMYVWRSQPSGKHGDVQSEPVRTPLKRQVANTKRLCANGLSYRPHSTPPCGRIFCLGTYLWRVASPRYSAQALKLVPTLPTKYMGTQQKKNSCLDFFCTYLVPMCL